MKAAVLEHAPGALSIEEIPIPAPLEGEVLVKVTACGVCHTDLHVIKAEVAFPTPAVLGHEISGTVVALGPGVAGPPPGTAVACAFIMPCGRCRPCAMGRDDLCDNFFAMNRLRGTLYDGTTVNHTHNDYVEALAETGVIGGIICACFLVIFFFTAWARVTSAQNPLDLALHIAALSACCAVLAHSLVDFNLHIPSNAFLFLVQSALATSTTPAGGESYPEGPSRKQAPKLHVRRATQTV